MSRYIDNIYTIQNNPFILTPLIIEFFTKSASKPKNLLLAYLVLPLVLYETSQLSIGKSTTRSSISSFKRKKENLYGLPERVERYKDITNKCLQHAIDNNYIEINKDLSVEVLERKITSTKNLSKALKASSNLHKIFKDIDIVAIYRLLGVKTL